MTATPILPPNLKVQKVSFVPSNQSAGGDVSATGFQQSIVSPGGRWRASITVMVKTEQEVLAYRAYVASLYGQAIEVLIAPRDGLRPRNASGLRLNSKIAVPWASGALWASGAGWQTPSVDTGTIALAAAEGAVVIRYAPSASVWAGGLQPGHYVGIADRIYLVTGVAPVPNSSAQDLTVWPRLRVAVSAGTPAITDKPACRMRLAKDDSGALETVWKQPAYPVLDFIESWDGA